MDISGFILNSRTEIKVTHDMENEVEVKQVLNITQKLWILIARCHNSVADTIFGHAQLIAFIRVNINSELGEIFKVLRNIKKNYIYNLLSSNTLMDRGRKTWRV